MKFREHCGRRGRARDRAELSPERADKDFQEALKWRDKLRAEMAGCAGAVNKRSGRNVEDDPRTKFAEAIARAEFGRAYWDKRLHEATRRPKRPK